MSTEHFNPANSHDTVVQKTAHVIEHRYEHGENLHHVLNDEVHQLRNSEYSHGHFSGQSFKHDLKQLEQKLQADHILPHIKLHTSGKHAGSIESIGRAPEHKAGQELKPAHKSPAQLAPGAAGEAPAHPLKPGQGAAGEAPAHPLKPGQGAAGEAPHRPLKPRPEGPGDPSRPADAAPPAGQDAGDGTAAHPGSTGSAGLARLKQVIDQAKADGRPLNMVQIGDSHIAGGIETPALANGLTNRFGVQVNYKGDGINGAHSGDALTNPGFFLKDINKNTDLVVVSFGSNDATAQAGQTYRQNYEKLLTDIRTKAPNAALVMVGPTDGAYWGQPNKELAGLDSVTREQRAAAATVPDSGYFDIRAKLGTISQMRSHGWMDSSNLHFTKDGYQAIGDSIAQFIQNNAK